MWFVLYCTLGSSCPGLAEGVARIDVAYLDGGLALEALRSVGVGSTNVVTIDDFRLGGASAATTGRKEPTITVGK